MAHLEYGELYKNDKYVRIRYAKYLKLLTPYFKQGAKVLEIGCYAAELADLFPRGISYLGADFDDGALNLARSKGFDVIKLDFNEPELKLKDKFDIIILAEILEHVIDPPKLLGQAVNLLNKDGVILVSLPNENTLYHRIMSFLGLGIDMRVFRLYKHLHFPTISQSRKFVSERLKIVKQAYYVNPAAKGSRFEWLGGFFCFLPDILWEFLACAAPGLFARGVIFLCVNKPVK